jgi:hypothetical protein
MKLSPQRPSAATNATPNNAIFANATGRAMISM